MLFTSSAKDDFTSPFLVLTLVVVLFCLIVLANIFSIMLNSSGDNGHPLLCVPLLSGTVYKLREEKVPICHRMYLWIKPFLPPSRMNQPWGLVLDDHTYS